LDLAKRYRQPEAFRFPRGKPYSIERNQLPHRKLNPRRGHLRGAQIDLRNVFARGTTGVEHDDRIGVHGGNLLHELVLTPDEFEGRGAAGPDEHHGNLCVASGIDCRLVIGFLAPIVQLRQLFFEGHFAQQSIYAGIPGDDGNGLCRGSTCSHQKNANPAHCHHPFGLVVLQSPQQALPGGTDMIVTPEQRQCAQTKTIGSRNTGTRAL
jgi:hypothetical protein